MNGYHSFVSSNHASNPWAASWFLEAAKRDADLRSRDGHVYHNRVLQLSQCIGMTHFGITEKGLFPPVSAEQ